MRHKNIDILENFPIRTSILKVENTDVHWHKELEIILVLSGSLQILLSDEKIILNEDDIYILNMREFHKFIKLTNESKILSVIIDLSKYDKRYYGISSLYFDCNSNNDQDNLKFKTLRKLLAEISIIMLLKEEGFRLLLESKVNYLLMFLITNFQVEQKSKPMLTTNEDEDRIFKAIDYINKNFQNKIKLEEVADLLAISPYYLSHTFTRVMEVSFQEYINIVRLDHALELLISSNLSITDISNISGFSSTSHFNKLFKCKYSTTPSDYRNRFRQSEFNFLPEKDENINYLDINKAKSLKKLQNYLEVKSTIEKINILISAKAEKETDNEFCYKGLLTLGQFDLLNKKRIKSLVKEVQRELGFKYIRLKRVFSENIIVYDKEKQEFDWSKFDTNIEFLLSIGAKPYIELNYLGLEDYAKGPYIDFWEKTCISFIKRCIRKYGIKEVEGWMFEFWDSDYYSSIIKKDQYFLDEYIYRYDNICKEIKSLSKKIRIGFPMIIGVNGMDYERIKYIKQKMDEKSIEIDYISTHLYPSEIYFDKYQEDLEEYVRQNLDYSIYQTIIEMAIVLLTNKLKELKIDTRNVYITEVNSEAFSKNALYDTSYINGLILSMLMTNSDRLIAFGYWNLLDSDMENCLEDSHFSGGSGIINKDGIKKASYYLYYLLNKLGPEILYLKPGYIVTREKENIQILLYNQAYIDKLKYNNNLYKIQSRNDMVYHVSSLLSIELEIKDLYGNYKITDYYLNYENGSSFDTWFNMGAPENMTEEELKYVKSTSLPKMTSKHSYIDGTYESKVNLSFDGIRLINLEKLE